jgi:hypothetical protein
MIIADRYFQWTTNSRVRRRYPDKLIGLVSLDGSFLDLGSGAGTPVAAELARLRPLRLDMRKDRLRL